jgi:hypothetical protein
MALDNLGILNANSPLNVITIQCKMFKQLHNIITGNDPHKRVILQGKYQQFIIILKILRHTNYNKLPCIIIIIFKCK